MVEEFETAIFSLKVGEVSQIIRSPFGFHIAQLYQRKAEGVPELAEVWSDIEQILIRDRKEKCIEDFVDQLRAAADIRKA
jgi:parvulin-like peptidyl-prolyl isomerase